MPFFRFSKSDPPQPAGSKAFQEFHESFLSNVVDEQRIRNGLDLGLLDRLDPAEKSEAERLLIERLSGADDSRAAIGLVALHSKAAEAPLRRAMAFQAGRGAFASPAFAQALWRLCRDPQALDALFTIARNPAVHESLRVEAVMALGEIPTTTVRQWLLEVLTSAPEYLLRAHSFKGLLMLHGYSRQQADQHFGPLAPHIAGFIARPQARELVMAKLHELTDGRSLLQPA